MAVLVLAVLGLSAVVGLADTAPTVVKEWVSNTATVLLAVAVSFTSGWAARLAVGRSRRGWWLMALAGALWAVGETTWLVEAYVVGRETSPAWSDLFYLLALVPAAAALMVFPPVPANRSEGVRIALTGVVVAGAVFFVSRALALSVILPTLTGSWGARAVIIAYPLADVVLASLALIVVVRSGGRRLSFVLLAAGFLVYSIADTVYVRAEALDRYTVGGMLDLGWVTGYALFALAPLLAGVVLRPGRSVEGSAHAASPDHRSRRSAAVARQFDWSSLALYLPLLAAVVVAASAPLIVPDVPLMLTGLVTLVAFALRQALLAGDHRRLREDLESQVSQLRTRSGELRQLASQNQRVLESVADGVLGVDAAGSVTFGNPQAIGLLGRTLEELVGTLETLLFADRAADEDRAGTEVDGHGSYIARALESGTVVTGARTRFRRGDGSVFPVELAVGPIRQAGEIVGAVVVFHDISAQLAVEKMRNEFISVVSHELRTPLTSIRGSLGMLEAGHGGDLTAAGARMVSIALGSSERLSRLIEDMLDIERMESGTLTMVAVLCDFRPLATAALHAVDAMAIQHGVQVKIEGVDATVVGDPDRIVQILTNLFGNAIKFSPAGGSVLLTVEQRARMVVFSVTDQGRGIPPDRIERIFERFEQVDSSDSRERGGTGLGLAITRDIIALHGGRLWVESVLGEGSTFRFTLPGAVGSVTAPSAPAPGAPARTDAVVVG